MENASIGDTIYTLEEVGEYFKVHKNTIYRWVKEGRLEAIKIGRTLRFTQTGLSKFIETQSAIQ